MWGKVVEPGLDRTVGPENPWIVQIHSPFKVRNRSMRKKHGTVRTAVRPSGSVNRDRFGRFRLFQPLNDVVQLLFFFFFPYTASFWNSSSIFPPPMRRRSALSQNHSFETLSHFSITLNPHSYLPLSKITLKSSHSQVSISPSRRRTVAAQPLSLAPSHCRSSVSSSLSRCCLSPASSSQCSLDRSSLVVVAAQPKYFIYGITNTKDSELQ